MGDYRLSLAAQFDDLVRNGRVLNQGIETEFLRFVTSTESCMRRWNDELNENQEIHHKLKHVTNDKNALDTKLKHARSQIDHEIRKRKQVEMEKEDLERQILLVRELLNGKDKVLSEQDREKLHFLSTDFQFSQYEQSPRRTLNVIEESASLLSDISYDKTEEDLEDSHLRSGKRWKRARPSAPPADEISPEKPPRRTRKSQEKRRSKRHRRSNSAGAVVTATVNVDSKQKVEVEAEIIDQDGHKQVIKSPRRSMKKYASAQNVRDSVPMTDEDDEEEYEVQTFPRSILKKQAIVAPEPPSPNSFENNTVMTSTPGMRRVNSAGKALNRLHSLVEKVNVKRNETCIPCGRKIGFGKYAMKCKECRACAHPEHKDDLPLPCVPSSATPTHSKNVIGVLADYAPLEPPMIPAIVIHCVNEIEHRGLHETGIYRVPGSEREVKDLKDKFMKNKGAPYLSNVHDIHVVCGCLKDFLRGLKEPIVTYDLWYDFVNAADLPNEECETAMYQAISQLPQANRDTLAFLMLHLQRVSESPDCKMNVSNLARMFGPTLVGFSSPNIEPLQMVNETRRSHLVVEKLMALSCDYWESFINIIEAEPSVDMHNFRNVTNIPGTPQTPELQKTCDYESILGPLGTPTTPAPSAANDTMAKRGWLTTPSRFGTRSRATVSKKSNHFFASPTLK